MESVPLPTDLILSGVFSRLPIASIVQCKLVCKTWNKLLKDQNFARKYSNHPPFTSLLYLNYDQIRFYMLEVSNSSVGDSSSILMPINRNVPHPFSEVRPRLVSKSSCNGLLCLTYENYHGLCQGWIQRVYVWNPITGGFIQLPEPNLESHFGKYHNQLGFVCATNQFKVVRVINALKGSHIEVDKKVQICTVGVDDKWRGLPAEPSMKSNIYGQNITCNGVYYWILALDTKWIRSLDYGEEKYGRISCPPGIDSHIHYGLQLKSLNDQLCVAYSSIGTSEASSEITFWTMKDGEWMKEVFLGSCFPADVRFRIDKPFNVARLGNGNILLLLKNGAFISFDTKLEKCTQVKVVKDGKSSLERRPFTYSPCFSSVFGDVVNGGVSTMESSFKS